MSERDSLEVALVTGGAGFIGSHIVDGLLARGCREVRVYDDFRTGRKEHLAGAIAGAADRLKIVVADVMDLEQLKASAIGCDAIFHFQANADVRGGGQRTRLDLEQNTCGTWNVLEAAKLAGTVETFVFASSATVYGEPSVFPTPESYAPMQTSLYGASKLAGEALIQAYSEYFDFRAFIFRFVSWIGERYSHGVIFDFVKKLRADPSKLVILGDGQQTKSYLHVDDGIAGIFTAIARSSEQKNVLNLGHDEAMNVKDLAGLVIEEMGLDPEETPLELTGGSRGWIGDSPLVSLDTTAIKRLGWNPGVSLEDGVRRTVRYLLANHSLLTRKS